MEKIDSVIVETKNGFLKKTTNDGIFLSNYNDDSKDEDKWDEEYKYVF